MKIHQSVLSVLLLTTCSLVPSLVVGSLTDGKACQDLAVLGTPNWDRYDGELEITTDEDACTYTWTATIKHDETLPVPDDPANQCNPEVTPPVLAADGLPYYAFRWSYIVPSDEFKAITGVDHISYDFNPCGHPPMGIFTIPHYDMHTYRVSPEFRSCMQCDLLPGTPVCNFNDGTQTTDIGRGFFTPVSRNLPQSFVNRAGDAVPVMGGHAWDPASEPNAAANWTEPVMVTGYYNDTFLYYEPMPPMSFVTGDQDRFWEQDLTYENQDIPELADYVSVSYNATTGLTTFTFSGPMKDCESDDSPPSAATMTMTQDSFWANMMLTTFVGLLAAAVQ